MRLVQIAAVQIAAALLTVLGSTVLFLSFQADLIRLLFLTVEDQNRALCLFGWRSDEVRIDRQSDTRESLKRACP